MGSKSFALLILVVVGATLFFAPVEAADPVVPAETQGAFRAAVFAPLPQESRIEVRLMDDSPENLELRRRIERELRLRDFASPEGEQLVLTIETDVSVITGTPGGDEGDLASRKGELDVLGFLRAELDNPGTGERLWAAEGVYRRSNGDLSAGAKSLVPLLVDTIGEPADLESVTIR